MARLPKIIVILGPTASGKTAWGIEIAQKYNGEIINADSRQVYKKMNIGTAKPAGAWTKSTDGTGDVYMVEGIAHHLMDMVEPDESFTLADFKARAIAAIDDIISRGKLPIVVGGTGLYIQSLVDNLEIPKVAPDLKLRADLEKKSLVEQVKLLKEVDPLSAERIDLKNSRRVLRALEVALSTGESFARQQKKGSPMYDALQIGLDMQRDELYGRINTRVDAQMSDGLLEETEKLAKKYSWGLPSMSGIGYKQMGYYLRGEMTLSDAIEILKRDTRHYAKRQLTWFGRDHRILWLGVFDQAEKIIRKFLK